MSVAQDNREHGLPLRSAGPPAPAVSAAPLALAPYVEAGIFDAYEVHLVASVSRLHQSIGDEVALALALAARAPRFGHVCTGLDASALPLAVADEDDGWGPVLPWPDREQWERALLESPLVAGADSGGHIPLCPLVWALGKLYLQRLWHDELQVADELQRRCEDGNGSDAKVGSAADDDAVEAILDLLFGADGSGIDGSVSVGPGSAPDAQRLAARRGMRARVSIIAGGPGTGKTHTVARVLAGAHLAAAREGHSLSVALAAPTGKAANRMGEAVAAAVGTLAAEGAIDSALAAELLGTAAVTLHRLLGARGDATFFHHRHRPLPHDLVIVDETSMVSLPLLADLVVALRPEARLVLVGDPSQLMSIEAGTVMSDLVGPQHGDGDSGREVHDGALSGLVTVLDHVHRYAADSGIAALAGAVRRGEVEEVIEILGSEAVDVRWVRADDAAGLEAVHDEVVADGVAMMEAARAGEASAALEIGERTKVLCATRRGPAGRAAWSDLIRSAVLEGASATGRRGRWYLGRPIMVTANDPVNRLFNGDVGVVVEHEGRSQVAMRHGHGIRLLAPAQFDQLEEWWAMTIHKSQGSEFSHAVVTLPDAGSPILTRELLYTGVTRARDCLTVIAGEEAIRVAVGRPVARASGLAERLWGMASG